MSKSWVAVPYVTNTAEPMVLPQPETLADEPTKAELSELLAQEHGPQANRRRLAHTIAENPTLLVRQRQPKASLDDETDRTRQSSRPGRQPPKLVIPTRLPSSSTLIMAEADHKITNFTGPARAP